MVIRPRVATSWRASFIPVNHSHFYTARMSSTTPTGAMRSCIHHRAQPPDMRCMGCRMAMGAPADTYFSPRDQRLYSHSDAPLSPTSPDSSICAGESDEESYLLRMRFALQEMDKGLDFVAGGRFLDLGCCPGGFSTYVLNKIPTASGEGVSLPVVLGGHSLAIPSELLSRFQVHWGDITRFNHAPEHSGSGRLAGLSNFPVSPNSFDLVLADGHLSPNLTETKEAHRIKRDLLLISQVLAAVHSVKTGGTVFVKFSLSFGTRSFDGLMHRLVLSLDKLSNVPLVALKPKSIYAKEGSFYVLVRGVEGVLRRMMELALETMWVQLVEGQGLQGRMLDRLVSSKDVKWRQEWLKEFLEPMEEIRRVARLNTNPY